MNSLIVTLVGMFVVFCALLLIILCIVIYSRLIRIKAQKPNNHEYSSVKQNNNVQKPASENNALPADSISPELLAVITAAVSACMQSTNTGYTVRSIKRIGHTTPIWNVAGRNEYILSKL
ncbi:MAG: OadG family protein [Bacillota bacterium]|jgi:sodium pump decarboxylase gamma subunit|nr:OadG family protein [Bacillota bacterium]NLV63236.1 OadG family protein [Clostridiaceae bacterium]